jgi:hypothetical protein
VPPERWTRDNHPHQATREEIARFLMVSRPFVDNLRKRNQIKSVHDDGLVRIDVNSAFDYRDNPPPPKARRKPGPKRASEG